MTAAETTTPEFLSRTEVARWLNLHPRSLANMAFKKRGPRFVRTGQLQGRALYRREDVIAWLESNVKGRRAEPAGSVEVVEASPVKRASRRRAKAGVASSTTSEPRRRSVASSSSEATQRSAREPDAVAGRRRRRPVAKTFDGSR